MCDGSSSRASHTDEHPARRQHSFTGHRPRAAFAEPTLHAASDAAMKRIELGATLRTVDIGYRACNSYAFIMASADPLETYRAKRNFRRTPEPRGRRHKPTKTPVFVVRGRRMSMSNHTLRHWPTSHVMD
jgi:hypothetical protein